MMVNNTQNHWGSGLAHCREFQRLENTMSWILDLFPSSDEGWKTRTLLGPLERASPNHWTACRVEWS
jgi:hypothetical protein